MLDNASSSRNSLQAMRSILLETLSRLGASRVCITYMGAGDSGNTENVSIEPAELEPMLETETILLNRAGTLCRSKGAQRAAKPYPLREALCLFVLDWLELEHPGWEINEGAEGEVNITLSDRRCCMTHTDFYMESESYEHAL